MNSISLPPTPMYIKYDAQRRKKSRFNRLHINGVKILPGQTCSDPLVEEGVSNVIVAVLKLVKLKVIT